MEFPRWYVATPTAEKDLERQLCCVNTSYSGRRNSTYLSHLGETLHARRCVIRVPPPAVPMGTDRQKIGAEGVTRLLYRLLYRLGCRLVGRKLKLVSQNTTLHRIMGPEKKLKPLGIRAGHCTQTRSVLCGKSASQFPLGLGGLPPAPSHGGHFDVRTAW